MHQRWSQSKDKCMNNKAWCTRENAEDGTTYDYVWLHKCPVVLLFHRTMVTFGGWVWRSKDGLTLAKDQI